MSFWLVFIMLGMVSVPAYFTLHRAKITPPALALTPDPSPYGYTVSLLLFIVPVVVIGLWLIPREEIAGAIARRADMPWGGEFALQRGTPYGMFRDWLVAPTGQPCNAPPWGALVAFGVVVALTPAVGGMARLLGVVARDAPGVALRLLGENPDDDKNLSRGEVDLDVGSLPGRSASIASLAAASTSSGGTIATDARAPVAATTPILNFSVTRMMRVP